MVAQNISPTTGFNVDYKSRGTRGLYLWSRTKNHNLSLAVSHTGRRYSVHAGYYNNHIEQQENGGVVGQVGHRRHDVQHGLGRADAPGRCRGAERLPQQRLLRDAVLRYSAAAPDRERLLDGGPVGRLRGPLVRVQFVEQGLHGPERSPTRTSATTATRTAQFVSAEHNYYEHWFINPVETRDSIYERVISNRVFVQAQPWDRNGVVGTIDAGVGLDLHTYSQFELDDYLTGRYTTANARPAGSPTAPSAAR